MALVSAFAARPVGLTLKDLKGQRARLQDYRGKVVVLNFWATWCLPCAKEMPTLVEAAREYGPQGVVFVAVSLDDRTTRPKIQDFVEKFQIDFPVWQGASTMDLQDLKLGEAVPATAFIDRDGRIVARVLGQIPKDQLKERLDWLTGDRRGPAPDSMVTNAGN
jgi:thiol-disulfide isomerase/thioredoxin